MFDSNLENELIVRNIADVLIDYIPVQLDIDDPKLKRSQKLAIDMNLTQFMSKENILRCIDQDEDSSEADKNLLKLVVPPLCHFTYMWLLKYNQGSIYESGYAVEPGAASPEEAKNAYSLAESIGKQYMSDVVEFLEKENPNTKSEKEERPRVRTFGGDEHWGNDYSRLRGCK